MRSSLPLALPLALASSLSLIALSTRAFADGSPPRNIALSGGGLFGASFEEDPEELTPPVIAGIFVRVGLDPVPLPYPSERGYNFDVNLTPELSLEHFGVQDSTYNALYTGVRADLHIAQKEMGLLRISARSGMWLAARIGLVEGEGQRYRAAQFDLGTYFGIGDSWRIQFEGGSQLVEDRNGLSAVVVKLGLATYL